MTDHPTVKRVLQVHTRYRQEGGEEQVVEAERRLLVAAGVSVEQVIFNNSELRERRSPVGDLRLAASAVWSRDAHRRVAKAIATHRPDVVHVHNTFAAASPSVYSAAASKGVPVVQTLHNYRVVCPKATVFRDGRACTDCVGRRFAWPAVLHACVRDSRPQSAVVAGTLALHRAIGTYGRRISVFIALTSFQRSVMMDGGLPADRVRVIPNFLEPDPGLSREVRAGVLYVGRLAPEKGVEPMLRAAALVPGLLRVAGAGPLVHLLEASAEAGDVSYLGRLDAGTVQHELQAAVALVLPSIWYEGFPMVVLEAYASAAPVIASRIGSLAEIVDDGVTGLLAEPGDPDALAERIRWAADHPDEMHRMGRMARERYETEYRGSHHLGALLDAYQDAIDRRGLHGG